MKLLKVNKKTGVASATLYYTLVVLVPIAILALTYYTESLIPPLALLLLSKWRVVAVRPRYWFVNLVANAVDIIVGVSHVLFVYLAIPNLVLQICLTLGYIVWLTIVKPRSSRLFVTAQGLTAIFVGVSALSFVAAEITQPAYVLLMFVIGYTATRHILTTYDEKMSKQISGFWGLVMAEMGWIFYWWLFAYPLISGARLELAQGAIIATLLSFVSLKAYDSYYTHGKMRSSDVAAPLFFALVVIVIILLFFNQISVNEPL